jgi:hypothetical protein
VEKEAAFRPAATTVLSPTVLARVRTGYEKQYDSRVAGWGFGHKYLDGDSVEYAMRLAASGNAEYTKRVNDTLHHAASLLDPVWGGMYQYSVGGHWSEPHFEKLISIQATALRQYSLAYAHTQNAEYLHDAQSVYRYSAGFLSSPSTGVFYVSQDADLHDGQENESYFRLSDHDRRAQGIPRIDKHIYARENGWMIAALCDYYAASGDASALAQAERAAGWISAHRALPGGGYRHDDADPAGPYLGDTLGMGQAFLALYNVTGNRDDLKSAASAGRFITAHFAPSALGTGFVTAGTRAGVAYPPQPDRDENIALVRFAAKLALATGDERFHDLGVEAIHYLAAESVALRPLSAGILLANEDATEAPIHVTVVGSSSNPDTKALHDAALRSIASHELIEIRDPSSPEPLPTKIVYPSLRRPALFLCSANACSSPVFAADEVRVKIERAQLQRRP